MIRSFTKSRFCPIADIDYYYFDSETMKFEKCSENCNSCESSSKCLNCNYGYFLNFNNANNYSCLSCFKLYNCSKCMLANKTKKIDINEFDLIQNIDTYNEYKSLYKWEIVCNYCITNYFRTIDSRCYKCDEEISDCTQCFSMSENGNLDSLGEDLYFLDIKEKYFTICSKCNEEMNTVVSIEKTSNFFTSKCLKCSSFIPNCQTCEYNIGNFNDLNDFTKIEPSLFFSLKLNVKCINCEPYNYINLFDEVNPCVSCPENCESCYQDLFTILCGRCKENFVLNIYEGKCYSIDLFTNLTDDHKNSCLRTVSENPWASFLVDSSSFLCQKCKDPTTYPSLNGKCLNCLDSKCSICYEAPENSINYTDILYKTPLSLLNLITQSTTIENIQKCDSCNSPSINALESYTQKCCGPVSVFLTPNGTKSIISDCESCLFCTSLGDNSIFCSVCATCAKIPESLLNDDNYIKSVDHLSSYYGKKIYYYLMNEGSTFNTTPTLNETKTYKNLYASLISQNKVDLIGSSIYKCSPCPISNIDCTRHQYPDITDIETFMYGDQELFDLYSYYLVPIKCREHFIYEDHSLFPRCKFCPNNWRSCKANKIIEIKYVGLSQTNTDRFTVRSFNELINFIKNLEYSEFAYICNEFSVKKIEIHVIFDINEEISWHDMSPNGYGTFQLESTLQKRILLLENYELIFIPKDYGRNTFSTLKLGALVVFKGFTSIKFINIVFKTCSTEASVNDIKMAPYLEINAASIFFKSCSLILEEYSSFGRLLSNIFKPPVYILSFFLNGADVQLENFEIENVTLNNEFATDLLNVYSFFTINSPKFNIKNLTLQNSNIKGLFSVINLKASNFIEKQNVESLQIINCCLYNSIFIRMENSIKLRLISTFIYNTTFTNKPFLASFTQSLYDLSIVNFTMIKANFLGLTNIYYFVSANFYEIKNVLMKECNFLRTTIIYFIEQSFIEGEIYLSNMLLANNIFEGMEGKIPFLLSVEFSDVFNLIVNIKDLVLENNTLQLNRKIYSYTIQFLNLFLVRFENITFINNFNVSGFQLENLNFVEFNNFSFIKNDIDDTQDERVLNIINIQNLVELKNLHLNSLYSETGIIYFEKTKHEDILCQLSVLNSLFHDIYIRSYNLASTLFISSSEIIMIIIRDTKFSSFNLDDQSDYQKSSGAIYIDSASSSCIIENSLFMNGISNGESNFMRIFITNLTLSQSYMNFANYFNKTDRSPNIISQGPFINGYLVNIFLNSSFFSKSYALNGAIYLSFLNKKTSIKINNCSFDNLFAISEGGALFITKNNDKVFDINISNCTFEYISALANGGILLIKTLSNSKLQIENSSFSRINAASGCIIYSSNLESYFNLVNISNNYQVFPFETLDYFSSINDLNFLSNLRIGSLINLKNGKFSFKTCNFFNLTSSTLETEATILNCQSCEFQDENSNYENIFFWKYVFAITNGQGNIINSNYFNISSQYFSNNILIDEIFLQVTQKSYYPIFFLSTSMFNISNVNIELIGCENCNDGGSFLSALNSELYVHSSYFFKSTAYVGLLYIIQSNLTINSSIFKNNIAVTDAANVFSKESNVIIYNCSFLNNSALNGSGGAINFFSEDLKTLIIISSIFENNIASIGGAIFYQKVAIYLDSLSRFENNRAFLYGNNYYSFPYSLCFFYSNTCRGTIPKIENFRSGASLNDLHLKLLDEEGNMIVQDKTNKPTLTFALSVLYQENESMFSMNSTTHIAGLKLNDEGIFLVTNLLLIGKPESDIKLVFSSPNIMFNSSTVGLKKVRDYSITLMIHYRNCLIGEFLQSKTGICFLCVNGTYSYHPEIEGCLVCPEGLNCRGGAETIVKTNYWRYTNSSEKIVFCSSNPYNCLGGKEFGNQICEYGHIGGRCESCDLMGAFWNASFSRTSNFGCSKCDDIVNNYLILAILSIFNFLSMILSIKGTIDNIKMRLQLKVIKGLARYGMFFPRKNESSIYLKIYFSYLQIIQVLAVMNLSYPNWINIAGETIGAPTKSVLYSTDCLVAAINSNVPYIHVKLIFALIIPFLYLIIFIFGYFIFMRKSKYHHKYSVLYTVSLFTLLYFQPNMIDNIISILSCVKIGDESYIKADVAYLCSGDGYYFYSIVIGVPSLFFWALGTPLVILYVLIKKRKNLNSITNLIRYGYLYDEYALFYWEFVRMYEKILITIVLSFFDSEILVKSLLVLLILGLYIVLLFKKNPYKTKKLNRADKFNSSCCYLSILFGLFIYNNSLDSLTNLSFIIILLINVLFNLFIWKNIISSITSKIQAKIIRIFRRLFKRAPFLRYFVPYTNNLNSKWIVLRRLVSRYLREKERVQLMKRMSVEKDEEKYKLSFLEYRPQYVEAISPMKKIVTDEEDLLFDSQESISNTPIHIKNLKTFDCKSNTKNRTLMFDFLDGNQKEINQIQQDSKS